MCSITQSRLNVGCVCDIHNCVNDEAVFEVLRVVKAFWGTSTVLAVVGCHHDGRTVALYLNDLVSVSVLVGRFVAHFIFML